MTNSNPNPGPAPTPIEVAPGATAPHTADELFAHGLLAHVTRDTPASREQRVARVLGSIHAEHRTGPLAFLGRAPARWIGIAAAVAIASVALFFTGQVQSSAQAVVQQSISALRAPGDRRFDLRITYDDNAPSAGATGTVDTRDGGLLLLRFTAPNGREVVVGRDEDGPWAIRPDGELDRDHPEHAWPKWATVGEESIAGDSVDRLLEELTKTYTLERRGVEELEGKNGRRFLHLTGEHKPGSGPGASRVEIWIDRDTKLIERLEMRWDARQPGRRPPLPGNAPDEAQADRPPPEGADESPDAPHNAPPPHDGPRDLPRDIQDRPEPPPFFPPGLGPPGPRGSANGIQPGPRRFRPPPPKVLVLERVDTAPFDSDWFSPLRHLGP